MKLNIEVESGSFEKIIEEGVKALSQDELKDIIKQAVVEAFAKCDKLSGMLIRYQDNGWGGPRTEVLGPLAEAAVKNIDLEKELAPIKAKMAQALMENHQRIVEDALLSCMVKCMTRDQDFQSAMERSVMRIIAERR